MTIFGSDHLPLKKERGVIQFTKDGKEIARYNSCTEAARKFGIVDPSMIAACARGKYEYAYGFVWEFIPDDLLRPSHVYRFKDRSEPSPWIRDKSKKKPPRIITPENNA